MMTVRCDDERAELVAAARAMREAGATMHEIARELRVPASTLYRWAAEGGWRSTDIASARLRAAFAGGPRLPSAGAAAFGEGGQAQAEARVASPDAPAAAAPGASPGASPAASPGASMTPLEARAAGERALKAAMVLMEAGELASAGQAMQLAERMLGAARQLEALPLPLADDPEAAHRRAQEAEEMSRLIRGLVKAALCGHVRALPHWATTKEFLADTLYPDQYYRPDAG